MNQPMTDFERMVDQAGQPLAWRGRWVLTHESVFGPILPASFPRMYYHLPSGGRHAT